MKNLTALVRLLDATADDRWRPGHPSTRPRLSAADRAHDATRPDDPTADAVCDEARIFLAWAWRDALGHVQLITAYPRGAGRDEAIAELEGNSGVYLGQLHRAYSYWLGHGFAAQ